MCFLRSVLVQIEVGEGEFCGNAKFSRLCLLQHSGSLGLAFGKQPGTSFNFAFPGKGCLNITPPEFHRSENPREGNRRNAAGDREATLLYSADLRKLLIFPLNKTERKPRDRTNDAVRE